MSHATGWAQLGCTDKYPPRLKGLTQWGFTSCSAEGAGDRPDYLAFGRHLDFPDGWRLLPESVAPGKHHLVFHVAWGGGTGRIECGHFKGLERALLVPGAVSSVSSSPVALPPSRAGECSVEDISKVSQVTVPLFIQVLGGADGVQEQFFFQLG